MQIRNINKKFVALIVSVLIGILSIWGFKAAFDSKVESLNKKGPAVSYVVASRDLTAGTVISTANVSQRNLPSEYTQSNAVTAENFAVIDGMPLKVNLKPGDIVMHSMVETRKDISKLISPGRRAITIPVDDESSISTMLKPGDLIDLMITLQSAEKTATVPLMQGVKILATGKQLDVDNQMMDNTGYTNITLDVTAEDAQNITLAASLGKISAILRNPNDQVVSDTSSFIQQLNARKQTIAVVQPITEKKTYVQSERAAANLQNYGSSNFNIIYGNKDE